MPPRSLICPQCQQLFTAPRKLSIYCSQVCVCAAARAKLAARRLAGETPGHGGTAAEARRASLARRRASGEIMGAEKRKRDATERDGRPVLVPATADVPEHVHFTLNGAAWDETAKRWRWQAPGVWKTIALAGYGCGLRVEKDTLVVQHGRTCSSDEPATYKLYRGAHDVSCIVLMSTKGSLSLGALQWCRDQAISVLTVDRNGQLTAVVSSPAPAAIALRSKQYTVDSLSIAKCLIAWKLRESGHVRPNIAAVMEQSRPSVEATSTLDALRMIEARAARVYWDAWASGIWWKDQEVPPQWRTFEQRQSVFSGSGRHATHPVNAMLNYGYAVLAGQIERAIVSRGLDPAKGHLHVEKPARPSLVYDLIEALRPRMDGKLLGWIVSEQWQVSDFSVDRSGVVRLHPQLGRVVVQKSALPDNDIAGVVDWYIETLHTLTGKRPKQAARPRRVILGTLGRST